MKKIIFLSLAVMMMTNLVSAQKGGILLYGNFKFLNNKFDNSNTVTKFNELTISPGVGYGICKSFIVGINLLYYSQKQTAENQDQRDKEFGIGPFVRYIKPISDIFDFRAQLNLSYLSIKSKSTFTNSGIESTDKEVLSGFNINLMPSMGIHAGSHWCIEFGYGILSYSTYTAHKDNGNPGDDAKTKSNTFGLEINPSSFSLGVSYVFGGEKAEK